MLGHAARFLWTWQNAQKKVSEARQLLLQASEELAKLK